MLQCVTPAAGPVAERTCVGYGTTTDGGFRGTPTCPGCAPVSDTIRLTEEGHSDGVGPMERSSDKDLVYVGGRVPDKFQFDRVVWCPGRR